MSSNVGKDFLIKTSESKTTRHTHTQCALDDPEDTGFSAPGTTDTSTGETQEGVARPGLAIQENFCATRR